MLRRLPVLLGNRAEQRPPVAFCFDAARRQFHAHGFFGPIPMVLLCVGVEKEGRLRMSSGMAPIAWSMHAGPPRPLGDTAADPAPWSGGLFRPARASDGHAAADPFPPPSLSPSVAFLGSSAWRRWLLFWGKEGERWGCWTRLTGAQPHAEVLREDRVFEEEHRVGRRRV